MATEASELNDAARHPGPAAGADAEAEWLAAPIEAMTSDDTGIEVTVLAVPANGRRRPRGGDCVRVGCFVVPSGPFAFAVAVAIHGAAIGAALVAARWYFQRPRLAGDWGGGGGGDVSLVDADADAAAGPAKPRVPGVAGLGPVRPTRLAEPPREQDRGGSPFSSARATQLVPGDGDSGADDPVALVGVAIGAEDARGPVFKRPGGATAGNAGGSSSAGPAASTPDNTPGSAAAFAAPEDGGGMSRHAGLPGALRGQGIPAPDYPPEARRRGEQGVVKVAVEVLPDGSVGQIRIVSDPGYPLLRDAALAATGKLRRFPFTPAYRFGNPVRDVVIIPYHFILR